MSVISKLAMMSAAAPAGPEGAWDLSYAYYTPINAWNVSGPTIVRSLSVTAQMSGTPEGIFFKPDGTKMYIASRGNGRVYEYDLLTPWVINARVFVHSVTVTDPCGVYFKDDGLQMYTVTSNGDVVQEYSLTTAWDISTRSLVRSFSVGAQDTFPEDLFFKPDGTKMYVVGSTGDAVYEYDLSTPWNISTATYLQNFSVASQEITPKGLFFKSDGTEMYVTGPTGDDVNQYTLSTPWDISTASYRRAGLVRSTSTEGVYGVFIHPEGTIVYTTSEDSGDNYVKQWAIGDLSASVDTTVQGMTFKPDGTQMFVVGATGDRVYMYRSTESFSVNAQESIPKGIFFKPDGTKMYIIGSSGTDVNEYDLGTPWDIFTSTYLQNFSVAAEETNPQGIFFKPDGTKMYVIGNTGDDVNEYDLSTPWDISTATYLQNFSIAAQETSPQGIFFKPDGTKMYVVGVTGQDVNEYDLSTAWDISTVTYLQNFSVATEETDPEGVFFKPDGTKMYIIGATGDDVNEYDLSTPWDISTAVYLQNFSVAAQESSPTDVFFKPDGTKMYIVGTIRDAVYEYDLSTAWDVSTSVLRRTDAWDLNKFSYSGVSFSVQAQEAVPTNVFFKPDGTKMYVTGSSGDDVNEYDLSTPWDISTASFLQLFSVAAQETSPEDLFFKPDGTKLYVLGSNGDDVNEYDLSTPWDISTATYLQNFSIAAQDGSPDGIFFKPDGTKMYIGGQLGDDINEYDLSTAWDISTATYLQNFSLLPQGQTPRAITFKEDGTQMFILDSTSRRVFSYTLGPQT